MSVTKQFLSKLSDVDKGRLPELETKISKLMDGFIVDENSEKVEPTPAVEISEQLPLLDIDFIKLCLNREEQGDADMLRELYDGRIVYDRAVKDWYWWNGNHWESSKDLMKYLYSAQVAEQYLRAAIKTRKQYDENRLHFAKLKDAGGEIGRDEIEKNEALLALSSKFIGRSKKLRKVSRTRNALEYMHGVMGVTGEIWDKDPWLIGVKNGMIDLKTGSFTVGIPSKYVRKVANIEYVPKARCPRFEQFLNEIFGGDYEIAKFIKRFFGYSITGLTTEHIFPIFWGEHGRNGKSTLINVLQDILNPLMRPAHKDIIFDNGRSSGEKPEPHLVALHGTRIAWIAEPKKQAKLKEETVKLATGGDAITARGMYESPITWMPTHQLLLITNPRPVMDVSDDALWERIILIPFIHRFIDNPVEDYEHKRDPDLIEKLSQEREGIFNWLIEGCLEWQKDGLNVPDKLRDVTIEYRSLADNFMDFYEENCIKAKGANTTVEKMFNRYLSWASDNPNRLNRTDFNKRMRQLGHVQKVAHISGEPKRCWDVGLLGL